MRTAGRYAGECALAGKPETGKSAALSWIAAIRPQFYVGPWLALSMGALAATHGGGPTFRWGTYFLACAAIALVEFITVMTNEVHDLDSDRANDNAGPFTGGSRVLVTGRLTVRQLLRARACAIVLLALVVAAATLLLQSVLPLAGLAIVGIVLGIGYSAKPLRLSARGLGELDVAFCHAVPVVLAGWLSQGGHLWAPLPWLLALPLGVAVLPSITLAGFPDLDADATTGKHTLAVRLGRKNAARLAGGLALLAAILPLALSPLPSIPAWYPWLTLPAFVHAVLICGMLARHVRRGCPSGRIDGLLLASLAFMFWFCLIPAVVLLFAP